MVAEQEHELKQKELVEEKEKNKFIEVISDNEEQIVSHAEIEAQDQEKKP